MPQLLVLNSLDRSKSASEGSGQTREQRYVIQKRIMTVGSEPGHDVIVSADSPGIVFSVNYSGGVCELMPSRAKLRVNGQAIHRTLRLNSCDRIEWNGGVAVFSEASVPIPHSADSKQARGVELGTRALTVLHNIATGLQAPGGIQGALYQTLDSLVELAGAEIGYLLSEGPGQSGWELVASVQRENARGGGERPSKKQLFSNTILEEALKKRDVVYVENIIGHPWAEAASIIEARIFSAACFPLCVGDRVLGAVFLMTRSAGRSIRQESLFELNLLATQAALMLASEDELNRARKENARLRDLLPELPSGMICRDDGALAGAGPMSELIKKARKLAQTSLGVLILGETGTGKEVLAREIHARSGRSKAPFVAVNCAAIPSALLESTLFGHEKGAFTGAVKAHQGKFIQANGGTLLLDEIGDLPLELQAKLLRVLQEKQVEPLGSSKPIHVDVRVLSATHQDLEAAVRAGRFRQDLYFRLNGASLRLPPLRERGGDIEVLANHFLAKLGAKVKFSPPALEALKAHSWPGNVRELEQVVTRAALLTENDEISASDLELQVIGRMDDEAEVFWRKLGEHDSLEDAQLAFTRDFVNRALSRYEQNRSETASRLGISERTLYRILADAPGRTP
ncbi:MAG TPA: sigma 54-interacting transcriptional regulator [Bdellovibrionota bacterium]|nr:sigma 54-interacting transcriptional regulator [Bdellovibrionota bacterium]